MIDEALFDAEEKMDKAVTVAQGRPRRASAPDARIPACSTASWSTTTARRRPITQLASINVPEARMVIVKPYEQSQLGAIETAIRNSDLGVNPSNDGSIIRISVPQLTEERRRELVKQAKSKGEDAKVSDPQRPPQGDGRARRASRRTAKPARTRSAARRRNSTRPRPSTWRRSTNWSSTRKPS